MSLDQPEHTTDHTGAKPGTLIADRYKLLEEIGEGGMGTVWVAEQLHPVRRKVAVKLIKAGMDSRQVVARFEAERQALALMDHPNIAKVLDGGTTEHGHPFFVMEYVKGVPFTRYCDEARLTVRERLELFVPVCQAVQHAHQKGIIHRDLKPSNILVCLYDGKPVPKVIDFGLAKALHQSLTEHTLHTAHGVMLGTPAYMSPEQAEVNNLDVDTRTDVYSLGVLLYELLTGTTPLEKKRLKQAVWQEMLRLIKEEEPPRPSAKLSSSESLPTIAAQRRMEPVKLSRMVKGELDWIVMKALEKERARRYETANGFARDVQRYLADEPVEACPPSAGYRLRKVLRKYRKPLATVTAFVLLLFVAGGVTTWQALRLAQAERDRAEQAAQQAQEQVKRSQDVHEALTRARELREQARAKDDVAKWAEARALAKRAEGLAEGGAVEAGLVEQVRALLREVDEEEKDRRMVATLEEIRLRQADVKDGRFDTAGADARYADAFRTYGMDLSVLPVPEVVARVRRSAIREQLLAALDNWVRAKERDDPGQNLLLAVIDGADESVWRRNLRQASARRDKARLQAVAADPETLRQPPSVLQRLGASLRLEGLKDEAVALLRQAQQRHPADFWINHELAFTLAGMRPKRSEEAIGYYRAAVALRPTSPGAFVNLGATLRLQKDVAGAIASFQKAIDLDPKYVQAHNNLGLALDDQKNSTGAIASFQKAIDLDPKHASPHYNLGVTLREQGDVAGAIASFQKAIDLNPKYASAHYHLGLALREQGDVAEAITNFKKAIDLDPKLAPAHYHLGLALHKQGDLYGTIASYKKAIDLFPRYAKAHLALGLALHEQKALTGAIASFRKAIELDPKLATAHTNLGLALHEQGDVAEAIASFQKAIDLDPKYAAVHVALGLALYQKDLPVAIASFKKAIELAPQLVEAHYNLGLALYEQNDMTGAVASFKKTIDLAPPLAEAHCNLGHALRNQGEFTAALAALRTGHDLGSKRKDWLYPSAQWIKDCERLVELDARLPAILKGDAKPADAAEFLAFADLCRYKKLYATATQLSASAFAADAKLADSQKPQHRYTAACRAALAAAGQGNDTDKLDASERARLRQQALDWLRADLARYAKLLEADQLADRQLVADRLRHWRRDDDLASVRDAAIDKLPADQREPWRNLWADVAALLKQAE